MSALSQHSWVVPNLCLTLSGHPQHALAQVGGQNFDKRTRELLPDRAGHGYCPTVWSSSVFI